MNRTQLIAAFRHLAADLDGIDLEVYRSYGRDPLDPVIGEGNPDSPLAFFGRDPGRDEVQHHMPFIGAGGQKVRATLYQHLHHQPLPDFAASIEVGGHFFWANTCPYKPVGNKAWSTRVKKRFQPLVADLLIHLWHGEHIITLGREAFLWFGLNQDQATQQQLAAFWEREDRFTDSTCVTVTARDGSQRRIHLYPLPHPSPLNATWYKRFPELLAARLRDLDIHL